MLWGLGFRPFFLLASAFAALSVPLWALQFSGMLGRPYLPGALWHAHELLFGFALAVIVGFLLTAGRTWSNRSTATGVLLMALVMLWLTARVLVLRPWGWAAALVNTAFPMSAAIALAIPFHAARNRRNYFFVGLLLMIAAAVLTFHLAQLQFLTLPSWLGIQVALDVVLFIMAVISGRVIPLFTNNGVPGALAARQAAVERTALGSVLALLLTDALQVRGAPLAALLAFGAVSHLARWLLWRPWKTLHVPLVWVLHLAYVWIPVHLALRAASTLGYISASVSTHSLTVGAIGGLTLGMMARTARGHTGRPLRADAFDVACYVLVTSAALVRVGAPLIAPAAMLHAVLGSAALWSASFLLFCVRYWRVLSRARIDGKPG